MNILNKTKAFAKRFQRDNRGNMAMVWGVCMTAVLMASGAAFDVHQHSKAKMLAQLAADNMALAASVAVDFGNNDKYVEHQWYTYQNIGGPSQDFTKSIKGKVDYDVDDDGDGVGNLLARATVKGIYKPAFFPIVGKSKMNFKATSDVAYAQRQGSPASIFFVVDNSGSMGNNDDSGNNKLAGVETSMKSFMTVLNGLNNSQNDIFRTALYPYSQDFNNVIGGINQDGVIPSHVVDPAWGKISNGNITRMFARSGTDSRGALQDAADALALEPAIHAAVNEEDDPLKFAVFMSDGANNQSYECGTVQVWVPDEAEYWIDTYNGWNTRYNSHQWWFDSWVVHYPASEEGSYQNQQTCKWDYWSDIHSLTECSRMKAAGTKVYSVAYDVAANEKVRAHTFMKNCASGDEYFMKAANANDLNTVFQEIGQQIVEEVIRVKR